MSDAFPKTLLECQEIVKHFSLSEDKTEYIRAIKIDNKIVGCIGAFFDRDIYCKNVEVAYWIGKDYRGKGMMTEILKQFSDDLFRDTGIIRIFARPFVYNCGSNRILEKAGYAKEGVMQSSVYKNGEMFDSVLYAKLVFEMINTFVVTM